MNTFKSLKTLAIYAKEEIARNVIKTTLDMVEKNDKIYQQPIIKLLTNSFLVDLTKLIEEKVENEHTVSEETVKVEETQNIMKRKVPITENYVVKNGILECKQCKWCINTRNSVGAYTKPSVLYDRHIKTNVHKVRAHIVLNNPTISNQDLTKDSKAFIRKERQERQKQENVKM